MGLLLGFDRQGIPTRVADELDEITAAIQVWSGKADAFGKWIDVPHSASYYTTDTGTWTVEFGDQLHYRYTLIGNTMLLSFILSGTTVSGTPSELRVRIPDGFRSTTRNQSGSVGLFGTGGGWAGDHMGLLVTRDATQAAITGGDNIVTIYQMPIATFPNMTNGLSVYGHIAFEVK